MFPKRFLSATTVVLSIMLVSATGIAQHSSDETRPTPVSVVYPSKRLTPLKLRAFIDFVAPRLTQRLEAVAETL